MREITGGKFSPASRSVPVFGIPIAYKEGESKDKGTDKSKQLLLTIHKPHP